MASLSATTDDDAINAPRTPTPCSSIYILLENPSKSNNLGPLLRCANAFGTVAIVAVGFPKCAVEGSHGASKHMPIVAFPVGEQAIDYLRNVCQCQSIVGLLGPLPDGYDERGNPVVSDMASGTMRCSGKASSTTIRSFPVDALEFAKGNICFVISKSRPGLPVRLAKFCDTFVHVPHSTVYSDSDMLLDTASCLSILLHNYTSRANYDERTFQGCKFQVARSEQVAVDNAKQLARASDRAARDHTVESDMMNNTLFRHDDSDGDY